jgi:hypothetical protein
VEKNFDQLALISQFENEMLSWNFTSASFEVEQINQYPRDLYYKIISLGHEFGDLQYPRSETAYIGVAKRVSEIIQQTEKFKKERNQNAY